jgi:hypothetical protein
MAYRLIWLIVMIAPWFLGAPALAIEYGVDGSVAAYQWVEDIGSFKTKEFGPVVHLGGFLSGAPVATAPNLRVRGQIRLMVGHVNYDTALISSPGTKVTTHSSYIGLGEEASLGWRVEQPRGAVEPFVGLGYRWWVRSIASNSSVSGYPEHYQMIYARLGLRGGATLPGQVGPYVVFSVDPVLAAREEIDLSDTTGEILRVHNGKRAGWTIEGGLHKQWGEVGLFWQAVRFGESNTVPCSLSLFGCLQPKSDQDIFGVRAAILF